MQRLKALCSGWRTWQKHPGQRCDWSGQYGLNVIASYITENCPPRATTVDMAGYLEYAARVTGIIWCIFYLPRCRHNVVLIKSYPQGMRISPYVDMSHHLQSTIMEILGASTLRKLLRRASFVIREASFSESAYKDDTIHMVRVGWLACFRVLDDVY
jgi:hypothetical protein